MQAFEFETLLHNGTLTVPPIYRHWEGRHVKVIVLEETLQSDARTDNASVIFKILSELSDDFMADGRQQLPIQNRENF
ncbi:MAG: hypothetical protein GY862_08585 [Gammaproteobacteria bacterium]|nr:hypothetical protein [Gammaproteobacteria bacterium]